MKHIIKFILFSLICVNTGLSQGPLFTLMPSKTTGINFRNDINETENLNVLAYEYFYNGGGVAVGDINNDGLPDIFFTANMGPNKLFLNQGNFKFKDITNEACPDLKGRKGGWKTGVTMADVNGDGLLDIYVCYSGKMGGDTRKNQLFINQGNLTFKEQAKEYGLDVSCYSTQAAFFDYDNDGDLDMFLLNHNVTKMDNMELTKYKVDVDPRAGNKLFENRNGHFVEVTQQAGIHQFPLTFGLGVAIADVNKDGWQDIYVTNDYNESDYLYINNHDGTFKDVTKDYFKHLSEFSMGVDIADFNNDGLPDIITLDMLPEDNRRQKLLQLQENYESFDLMQSQDLHKQYMRNMLQLNNGNGTFSEIGQLAGISNTDWSWCPLFADFDNDGLKDLLVTTGYLRDYTNKDFLRYWGDYKVKKAMDREPTQLMDLIKAMPVHDFTGYVFKNNGDLTFKNMQKDWGLSNPSFSNGAVYADLDNDGDLDIITNNINDEPFIYKNNSRENNSTSYLSVKLNYKDKNKNGVGSKVYVYNKGTTQYQEVNPNRGYEACVPTTLNFGLGNAQTIDSIKVIWPDQTATTISTVKSNQHLVVDYHPSSNQQPLTSNPRPAFKPVSNIIDYTHSEFSENDFKRQLLMMMMYSKTGPVIAKADVNKDGLEDLFISGDKNKTGKIYLQKNNGTFSPVSDQNLGDENTSITSAATFFDANGDGSPDLYIAKGGYSLIQPNTDVLQDELYINDGKGNFILSGGALPNLTASSKSCVVACDYDNDGDMDLFVGGRVVPGSYPVAPKSFLLNNDGKGNFKIVASPFDSIGMVTAAAWVDINKDGRKDLVLCGEFMPVRIFINTKNGFVDSTAQYFQQPDNGLWFSLAIADVDGDGYDDIITGNWGLNSQVRFNEKEPAELYYADFDGNGSIDPFLNFYVDGISYPFVSRDELNEQLYSMRKKFTSYNAYADAQMKDIFPPGELHAASKLSATESRSVCYLYKNGKYVKSVLPVEAQFSIVTQIIPLDYNKDGKTDLLLLGNHSDNRLKIGSIDANYGCLLQGDGKGNFTYISQVASGYNVKGDVKSSTQVTIGKNKFIIIGSNNEPIQIYQEP